METSFSALLAPYLPKGQSLPSDIRHLRLDSRQVQPGDAFIAIHGTHADGRAHIPAAIERGAVLVLAEGETMCVTEQAGVLIVSIPGLKALCGSFASKFYDEPSKKLPVFGVTGTNGKTSYTHFLAQAFQVLGEPTGVIGTLGSGIYPNLGEAGLTTPDAASLQALLSEFVAAKAAQVAMEVSSHSIHQGRIQGMTFETVIFTNLTQDHLDYHGSMEAYAAVKYKLFTDWPAHHCVLNAEDDYGRVWAALLSATKEVQAYAVRKPKYWPSDVPVTHVRDVQLSLSGMEAQVISPWGEGKLVLPLIGQFNLSNVLAVLVTLCLRGYSFPRVLDALRFLKPVPGRMQTLGGHGRPLVVVDYAHTPDALDKVLQALRSHTKGDLICVFGCGGDRDPGKRPLMAKMVQKWANKIIVTNDNPRHEAPEAILEQIMAGFAHPDEVFVELDRAKAIQKSIQWANGSDCVLIAGKGAEKYQQIGDEKFPFDDMEVAKSIIGGI